MAQDIFNNEIPVGSLVVQIRGKVFIPLYYNALNTFHTVGSNFRIKQHRYQPKNYYVAVTRQQMMAILNDASKLVFLPIPPRRRIHLIVSRNSRKAQMINTFLDLFVTNFSSNMVTTVATSDSPPASPSTTFTFSNLEGELETIDIQNAIVKKKKSKPVESIDLDFD